MRRFIKDIFGRTTRPIVSRKPARAARLRLESLEDRVTPAIDYTQILNGLNLDLGHMQAHPLKVYGKNAPPVLRLPPAQPPRVPQLC